MQISYNQERNPANLWWYYYDGRFFHIQHIHQICRLRIITLAGVVAGPLWIVPVRVLSVDQIKPSNHLTRHRNLCFNQRGDISTLNGSSLKLVDKFTYLGSSVSSTETDINKQLAKAWTVIDRPSVIWKSWPIKWNGIFPTSGRIDTAVWMHYMDANKTYAEKAWWQLPKNAVSNIEQVLEAPPHKAAAVRPLPTNYENYPS